MQRLLRSFLAGTFVVGLASTSLAQQPFGTVGQRPYQPLLQPAFSPYLNLNRGGSNPGINYFGLVRPQIDTQRSLQSLQAEIQSLPTDPLSSPAANVPVAGTGHPVAFFNTSHYYNTLGGRSGTSFGAGRGGIGSGNLGSNSLNLGGVSGAVPISPILGTNRR